MPLAGLSQAWVDASAALPIGWRLAPPESFAMARPAGVRRWHDSTLRILIIGKRERAAAASA